MLCSLHTFSNIIYILFKSAQSKENLLSESLPEITKAFDKGDILFVFNKTKKLLENYPENKIIEDYFLKSSWLINVDSDLDNTKVFIKYYKDSIWNFLGKPLLIAPEFLP